MSSFDIRTIVGRHEQEMANLTIDYATNVRKEDEDVGQLLDYLDVKTGGERLPRRSDLNPADLKNLLADITLLEPVYDDEGDVSDVIVRLIGSNSSNFYGDFTDKSVKEHPSPDVGPRVIYCVRAAVAARQALLTEISSTSEDELYSVIVRGIYVPMSQDGETINRVMVHLKVSYSRA